MNKTAVRPAGHGRTVLRQVVIEPLQAATLERAAQLTQRTNQHNARKREMSADELRALQPSGMEVFAWARIGEVQGWPCSAEVQASGRARVSSGSCRKIADMCAVGRLDGGPSLGWGPMVRAHRGLVPGDVSS